jgi:hypothetical protein
MQKKEEGRAGKVDTDRAKAGSHLTRVRAMRLMRAANKPLSPKDVAIAIYGPHYTQKEMGHVAYHVRKLGELGQIEETHTVPVRGATQHFYTPTRARNLDKDELLDDLAAAVNRVDRHGREALHRTLVEVGVLLRRSGREVRELG